MTNKVDRVYKLFDNNSSKFVHSNSNAKRKVFVGLAQANSAAKDLNAVSWTGVKSKFDVIVVSFVLVEEGY
ncbi:MAG: hypothetical protein JKY52_09575 [Flavobacteriales bacterium]|nr:hypothetical protein [Flavobacteriales bacterium]